MKTLEESLEEEKVRRSLLPWYVRVVIDVGEWFWYKVILDIKDCPREIKWKWQEITRGYSDCDLWGLDYFIIKKIRVPLKEFIQYQREKGCSYPNGVENREEWIEILGKIEFAFDSVWDEENNWKNPVTRNMNNEELANHYKKIQEGFELFGKFLQSLWD